MYWLLRDIVFIFIHKCAMTMGSRIVVENEFRILQFFFLSVICWDFYTNSQTCFKKEADNPILQSDVYREKIGQLAKNSVYWS